MFDKSKILPPVNATVVTSGGGRSSLANGCARKVFATEVVAGTDKGGFSRSHLKDLATKDVTKMEELHATENEQMLCEPLVAHVRHQTCGTNTSVVFFVVRRFGFVFITSTQVWQNVYSKRCKCQACKILPHYGA